MIRRILLAGLAVLMLSSTANAGVIFGLLQDPLTTAGGGATSTRSGAGTWHLYALDDGADLGIALYNVTMSGATAINHRSPVTTVQDENFDTFGAGFPAFRSATNANPILAGQLLVPNQTKYPITGFGVEASNFAAKVALLDPLASVVGPTVSGSWGVYLPPQVAPRLTSNGLRNWVFLAEGAGTGVNISQHSASVYLTASSSAADATAAQTSVELLGGEIPEPASLTLVALGAVGVFGFGRRRRS
jgi:hypothetical protein